MLKIERVGNGFVLHYEDELKKVYQLDDENKLDAVVELLYEILIEIGFYGSKHDDNRIRIIIEKQGE